MFRSARGIEGAIDEIGRWADSLPGEFAIEVIDYADGAVIAVTGVLISSGLGLRAWIHLDESAWCTSTGSMCRTRAGSSCGARTTTRAMRPTRGCEDRSTSTVYATGRRFVSRRIRSTSS